MVTLAQWWEAVLDEVLDEAFAREEAGCSQPEQEEK